ncbi:IMP 5'-nucleotidase [Batrachochytrium dendrobatidis]|nr:IMP 5'-nucleotidase [Batrachochytrium dendrobatidis]KAK5665436.1 IMP 5'-nucleotidase [Batrachochytrium dendrobatidis]
MSSLYSINYHLRAHKRDTFIEFIKSLLLTPFVLNTRVDAAADAAAIAISSQGSDNLITLDASEDVHSSSMARYLEIFECIEDLVKIHIMHSNNGMPELSRLSHLVPNIGRFFTPLPLRETFLEQSPLRSIAARHSVPPSFNDIRHILNFAQVKAISSTLKLITFDGDMTLYADGADFARDSQLVQLLVKLLAARITVAIVTAAGYGNDAVRYESRLSGLLEGFKNSGLDHAALSQFYVLGGECNYLFRYSPETHQLVYISEETYQPERVRKWSTATGRIKTILDAAEVHLRQCAKDMHLNDRINIMRKDRAVGVYPNPGVKLTREQLDELALSTQHHLNQLQHIILHNSLKKNGVLNSNTADTASNSSSGNLALLSKIVSHESTEIDYPIPFCAFNGGSDVWVDIGNKLIGVGMLQDMLHCEGCETLHVGDQFSTTGNDVATRRACCTAWIANPEETAQVLLHLTDLLDQRTLIK